MSFFQKRVAGGHCSSVRKKSAELQRAPATHLGTGTLALGFLAKGRNRPKLCQFYLYFPFLPPQTPQIYSLLSLFASPNPANLFITFPFCLLKPRKFIHYFPFLPHQTPQICSFFAYFPYSGHFSHYKIPAYMPKEDILY
jgi:hypothetical protein